MVDTKSYLEWFKMAKKDLKSANILYQHNADYEIVCFHCQQAIEKYLKGYLIFKTGFLQEGHSLIKLCKKAEQFEKEFNKYLKDLAFVNTYYIETRYPAEDPLNVSEEDAGEALNITNNLIAYIEGICLN